MEWWWECRKGFKGSQLLNVRHRGFGIAHWGAPCQGGTAVQQGVGQGENCIPVQNMSIEWLKVEIFQVLFCLHCVWLLQTDLKLYLSQTKRKRFLLDGTCGVTCMQTACWASKSLAWKWENLCLCFMVSQRACFFGVSSILRWAFFIFYSVQEKKGLLKWALWNPQAFGQKTREYLMLWHLHLASV